MAQVDPVKVLVVGEVLGQIRPFCDKVKTLDGKYGPFAFIICVGDFFASEGEGENSASSDLDDLLGGNLEISKTTYIMGGGNIFPSKVTEKLAQTGGEITHNLLLLDKANVITTSQGIRIAALGGAYDPASYDAPKYAPANNFTTADTRRLLSHPSITTNTSKHQNPNSLAAFKALAASGSEPVKIDILLTHAVPTSLVLHTPNLPNGNRASLEPTAPPLDDLVRAAMPRYHFVSGPNIFWEREPFGWPGLAEDGRVTRFISVGAFGGAAPPGGKKQRWSYAFSIVPLTPSSPTLPTPANVTSNPFMSHSNLHLQPHSSQPQAQAPGHGSPKGQKRAIQDMMDDGGQQFRWAQDTTQGAKRRRKENADNRFSHPNSNNPRACRNCGSTDHANADCPERSQPPEGYICRRCQQAGHYIRDCPLKEETGDTGGRKPPAGYVCRACGSELHMIDDCPVVVQKRGEKERGWDTGGGRKKGAPQKEIAASECWFCLSNPNLAKHLLVSLGEECYLSLPKGQLPVTSSDDPRIQQLFPVPGGGHLLIIPISHHPTLRSLPAGERESTLGEVEKYKSALRSFYAHYNASPIFFEVAKKMLHGVHAQVQVLAVPNSIGPDEVAETLLHTAKQLRIDLIQTSPEEPGVDLLGDTEDNYFLAELSDGRKLASIIEEGSRFPLQFARTALATLFGLPDRVDWKECVEGEKKEKTEAEDFKKAFSSYDPFL